MLRTSRPLQGSSRFTWCLFDLFDGGEAQQNLFQPVIPQGFVADFGRRARNILHAPPLADQRAHFLGDEHEFVKRDPAFIAGLAAGGRRR